MHTMHYVMHKRLKRPVRGRGLEPGSPDNPVTHTRISFIICIISEKKRSSSLRTKNKPLFLHYFINIIGLKTNTLKLFIFSN